jgi:hypothetical protein
MMKLIAYKGGGYDGCIWEWNYALYKDKEYISIVATGYFGCKTKEEFEDRHGSIKNEDDFYAYDFVQDGIVYEIPDLENHNLDHIITVGSKLHDMGIYVQRTCSMCGQKKLIYGDEEGIGWYSTGYKGAGGLMITSTGVVCEDCYCSNTCNYCSEFIEPDSENVRRWDNGCTYCEHGKDDNQLT